MHNPRWWLVAILAALESACSTPTRKAESAAPNAYADPKACAGCHADKARSFALTGMGRSIGRPNTGEDFTRHNQVVHRSSERTFTMTVRDGAMYQRRHQTGPDGREINAMEKRAEMVIGSGNHARSYLARNGEGKWVEMPVTWYAARGGFWDMSPGYDRANHEEFRRVVPDECLFCHSSYAQPLQAIDCQRCHGPGKAHADSAGRAAIVNPRKLSRERQLDICMQCHLETTSSPLPNAIRRFERTAFSFRPGEALGDFNLYFDHAAGTGEEDKFEIAHAAYRLRKSVCFQKSAMTCSSCHDPHRVQRGGEAAGCKQCHAAPHNANTTCIDCHMPKRATDDVPQVAMTDHFIQRRPTERGPQRRAAYQGDVVLYYPGNLSASEENEAYLAIAQVQRGANLAAGIPRLEAALGKLTTPRPEFHFELAKAWTKHGDEAKALRSYEAALRLDPGFRPAIKGMAVSLIATGSFERAAALIAGVTDPDARMLTNRGQALLKAGRMEEAARVLEQAAAANPDLPEPHDLLGLLWLRGNNVERAEAEFREAIRIQPDLATAHSNLAGLLAERKNLAEARYHFQKALQSAPGAVETHRSYGFLLILMHDYSGARRAFAEALRLAPARADIRMELAELESAGR
ncbi:MAG: tetratricopeptide repeat protein [Acidobacteria bacterium]|nr:tetratricopeptide repeat protein [Acidobacteriota bacterium]